MAGFRRIPTYFMVVLVVGVLGVATWGVTYALWVQPDPQVISLADPIPNAGTDAKGVSLDQFVARGGQPKDYVPLRKTTFRAGESLWILRSDCFVHKTQDGIVSRAFLGGDGGMGTNRSVYALPDLQIPTRTDGCAVKNHRTAIPLDLPAGR